MCIFTISPLDVLLEEFKARWQELLQINEQVSTWMTLYATAVLVSIGWIVAHRNENDLSALLKNNVSRSAILFVPVLSGVFFLAISLRGYEIHQTAQYIDEVLAPRISALTHLPFNDWDSWRRMHYVSGTAHKTAYILMNFIPAIVSIGGLIVYAIFVKPWREKISLHSVSFYLVALLTSLSVFTAIWLSISTK